MKFEIPKPLQAEHAELHAKPVQATKEGGAVGEVAREVARLLHPHFVREEEFVLPPLGLLAEHRQIVGALEKLRAAAHAANLEEHERFAEALVLHAQTEEQVLYPAAILLGDFLQQALEATAAH